MATAKKPVTKKPVTQEKPKTESFESLVEATEEAPVAPTIRVKFVETGFTAFQKVWSAGEELEVEIGGPQYESSKNIYGDSWLDMDQTDQISKWGKVLFVTT